MSFAAERVSGVEGPVRRYFMRSIAEGAPLALRFRFTMTGRIRVGAVWLPFTAEQESSRDAFAWTARVGIGSLPVLHVTDRYAAGAGVTEGRLFARRTVFRADDEETTRSAAGRAAIEACAFAPATVLPEHGVSWRAERDDLIVASWDLPPERPSVRIRIGDDGAIRALSSERWSSQEHRYVPCGGDVQGVKRFGAFSVPTEVTVSWWYGTERAAPFFTARIHDYEPIMPPGGAGPA